MPPLSSIRVILCALALGAVTAAQQPPAIARPENPSPHCTTNCVALPDAPSSTEPAAPPEPKPAPYSLVGPVVSAPYVALSAKQKFGIFVHHTYSPYTFVSAALNATWAQMIGDLPGYGGGMQGWGKRFGANIAATETRSFTNSFLFPTITHEDPRYFPMHKGKVLDRIWYAGTRVLITRKDTGGRTLNYSELLGTAASLAISNAYLPERNRGAWETFNRYYGAIGSDAGSLVLEEFWPDIQRFLARHEPRRLRHVQQKVEDKIPTPLKPAQ